jgi:hypothetical protein
MFRRYAVVLIALVAPAAHAETTQNRKGARLSWVRGIGAERCVGTIGLEEDVKTRLGYSPFALKSELLIEGAIVRQSSGFRAELVVRDAQGEILGTRALASRGSDCRSLGEAVAVAITVAINPDALETRAATVEEVPPEPPSPPPPAPPSVKPIYEERGRVELAFGASVGLLPGVAPGTSLRFRLDLGPAWEIGVGAHVWSESREAGLGFSLVTGSLDACFAPLRSARALRWCASGHVGMFGAWVHAPELGPVEVGMFPWGAAETGPALSVPLAGPLRIDANVSGILPIPQRQAFVRGRAEPVWEQAIVGGRADVGIAARF